MSAQNDQTNSCTEPEFPAWWEAFGLALTNRMNIEAIALAAWSASRHRVEAEVEDLRDENAYFKQALEQQDRQTETRDLLNAAGRRQFDRAEFAESALRTLQQEKEKEQMLARLDRHAYEDIRKLMIEERMKLEATLQQQVEDTYAELDSWRAQFQQEKEQLSAQGLEIAARLAFVCGTDTPDTLQRARIALSLRCDKAEEQWKHLDSTGRNRRVKMTITKTGQNWMIVLNDRELARIKVALDVYVAQDEHYYKDEVEMRDIIVASRKRFKESLSKGIVSA